MHFPCRGIIFKNVNSLPSPWSDTSLHFETKNTGLSPPQLSLVLIAPTHEGMAKLSWPGWLVASPDEGLPICRRLLQVAIVLVKSLTDTFKTDTGYVGPETWWIHYPSASGGMQSPIDIETEEIYHDAEFGRSPLEVHYHLQAAPGVGTAEHEGVDELWTLVNTGWTLQVNITNSQSCKSLRFDLLTFRRGRFTANRSAVYYKL